MFESSLTSSGVSRRKLGVGVAFSVATHLAVVAAALLAGRHVPVKTLESTEVVFRLAAAPPLQTSPRRVEVQSAAAPPRPPTVLPHDTHAPRELRKHIEAVDRLAHAGQAEPAERPGSADGQANGLVGATGDDASDSVLPPSTIVLPFGEGMNRPELLAGPEPTYKPEALAANVQGTVLARCVITTEGTLEGCRIIKSMPFLDQPVLDALSRRRYRPVSFQGHPIAVDYVIEFKFKTT
jgi:protein TonB